jgi:hypothetical protein
MLIILAKWLKLGYIRTSQVDLNMLFFERCFLFFILLYWVFIMTFIKVLTIYNS